MKYFTIAELCKSTTADRLGINNRCRQEHVTALTALVDNVLDPLRTWWGKPITVNSGYRCPELNAAVKGSKTSQHMVGEAADIDTGDRQQNKLLFEYIRKNLPYDQLIDESNFAWDPCLALFLPDVIPDGLPFPLPLPRIAGNCQSIPDGWRVPAIG